jgi:hypothetical protein
MGFPLSAVFRAFIGFLLVPRPSWESFSQAMAEIGTGVVAGLLPSP